MPVRRLDVLVNNAAIGRFSRVEDTSDDDWRSVIETNCRGRFCARAAIPASSAPARVDRQHRSLAGASPFNGAAYCASKAG